MKKSEILRKAKKRIEEGSEVFICCAIATSGDRILGHVLHTPSHELTYWVRSLLDGYCTLDGWLANTHGICSPSSWDNRPKMKATRLAWLDWMIQYWEAKEKELGL